MHSTYFLFNCPCIFFIVCYTGLLIIAQLGKIIFHSLLINKMEKNKNYKYQNQRATINPEHVENNRQKKIHFVRQIPSTTYKNYRPLHLTFIK